MGKPLIFIIEDEPPLEMLSYNLEKAGLAARVISTGEEALHWIEVEVPDLVIVDWMLPDLSGIQVCKTLRAPGRRAVFL